MDPVTHTLVGATFAESGLKRRTALGTVTLLLAANFPDIDVASYFWGNETALWFRRGVTHGLVAIAILPFVLTGIVWGWDRLVRRRFARGASTPVIPSQILLLSFIGVASHPVLDFLNVYGMRWLMPFSDRWFYGDTLFIVDPWVWAVLVAGLYAAKRREGGRGKEKGGPSLSAGATRAPRLALVIVSLYVLLMLGSNLVGRRIVTRTLAEAGVQPRRLMVAPVPANPFRRSVVVEGGDSYRFGTVRWLARPWLSLDSLSLPNHPADPTAAAAMRGPKSRQFLSWARFPFYVVHQRTGERVVFIGDARYTLDPESSWASTSVSVPESPPGVP